MKRGVDDVALRSVGYFCGNYRFVAENHGSRTADRWMLPSSRDVIPVGLMVEFKSSKGAKQARIAKALRSSDILRREVTRVLFCKITMNSNKSIQSMRANLQVFLDHKINLRLDSDQLHSANELKAALESLNSGLDSLIESPM
jgi:hypothetical protein